MTGDEAVLCRLLDAIPTLRRSTTIRSTSPRDKGHLDAVLPSLDAARTRTPMMVTTRSPWPGIAVTRPSRPCSSVSRRLVWPGGHRPRAPITRLTSRRRLATLPRPARALLDAARPSLSTWPRPRRQDHRQLLPSARGGRLAGNRAAIPTAFMHARRPGLTVAVGFRADRPGLMVVPGRIRPR